MQDWPKIFAPGALAMCVLLLASGALATTQASGDGDARAVIRSRVDLVVVPVTVKDSDGSVVTDLRPEEFRIFEDDIEQKITLFSADPFPLSAVILIDNALSPTSVEQVRKSLRAIAGAFSPDDEFALYTFDAYPKMWLDFAGNTDQLFDALKRLEIGQRQPWTPGGPISSGPRINTLPVGPTLPSTLPKAASVDKNIDDAIFGAANALLPRERSRRKIVLIVSDGANSRRNVNKREEVEKLLLSADAAVYAVGVGDAVLNRVAGVLSRYARATGGDIFYALGVEPLEEIYGRLTEQARYRYTLGYVPSRRSLSHDYRRIEVRVRRPGLTLLARDGYYYVARPQ
jgi:VWFA-related protein